VFTYLLIRLHIKKAPVFKSSIPEPTSAPQQLKGPVLVQQQQEPSSSLTVHP